MDYRTVRMRAAGWMRLSQVRNKFKSDFFFVADDDEVPAFFFGGWQRK